MRRRELLLMATAMMAARAVHAQQRPIPVIGFFGASATNIEAPAGFRQGLSETGWVDGQNLRIEYRWADGHYDRLPAFAAEFVGRKVDLILATGGNDAALAAKNTTSTIPIVFVTADDPVADGVVASLARPGGNLTGFTFLSVELMVKKLDLITELVPRAAAVALLVNPEYRQTERIIQETKQAARAKGVQLRVLKAANEAEIDDAFSALVELHPGALVQGADPFFFSRREQIVALASREAIPAIYAVREFADGRRPDQLWRQPLGGLSGGGYLCRANSQGRKARRPAGAAADHLRAGRQSQHRQGARAHGAAIDPRPRR